MNDKQVTSITNGLRPLIEYVDLDLQEDTLIFSDVETIKPCFGFDAGHQFEVLVINIADGAIELVDSDAMYRGRILITLPDQLDEFPRADAESDSDSNEDEDEDDDSEDVA